MRAYKTVNDAYIEPISFTVPRRAETFQSDIFPPCTGFKPAMSANDWVSGKTALPAKIDLESVYEGSAVKEVAADYKPPAAAPAPTPAPVAKPAPKEPEPSPVAARAPPPSMAQQKGSMSAAASKFQDNDDDDDDAAETSSFEEVQKPVHKTSLPSRSAEPAKPASPVKSSSAFGSASSQAKAAPSPIKASAPAASSSFGGAAARSGQASPSVETSLDQIKAMIEAQTRIITGQGDRLEKQNDAISQLTSEVETLKKRVVSAGGSDQSERIRQLELELEEARS